MPALARASTPPPVRIERKGRVAILVLDAPHASSNVADQPFLAAFDTALSALERAPDVRAVVVLSAKRSSFVSGADVHMFDAVRSAEEGARLARLGQKSLQRLAELNVPTVAAIHGACLGRGLELALACDVRIATNHRTTRFAMPEIQLGLVPCAGGTQRLPRLIGLSCALDLILSGKHIDVARANTLGLVDDVVPAPLLRQLAIDLALSLADKPSANALGRLGNALTGLLGDGELQDLLLEDNPFGRKVLFDTAKKKLQNERNDYGPAPLAALEAIKSGASRGMKAGLHSEATAFGSLVVGSVAKQLMALSFAHAALKSDTGVDDPAVASRPVDKVCVVGAGLMGTGVAYMTARRAGTRVRLIDRTPKRVGKGMARLRAMLGALVDRGRITERRLGDIMAQISPTTRVVGLSSAQVVIEAVFDDLLLKQKILRQVEQSGSPDIIFASTTSTIPISKIAEASAHPETVVGMHYAPPVNTTPLLEVVRTRQTAPWVTATCVALGKRQGKTVIVVGDGVGFYTSRVVTPYISEALHLISEGIPACAIDAALVEFGFPIGPIQMLDDIGFDIAQRTNILMGASLGARIQQAPGIEALIADERLGKRNGRGFYRYDGKRAGVDRTVYKVLGVDPKQTLPAAKIAQRCVLQLVNEAAHCLGDDILRSPRDGDVGAISGLGFPAFRGGPFRYMDTRGAARIIAQLREYEATHGIRYAPAPILLRLAAAGQSFYPRADGMGSQTPADSARG